MPAYLLEIGTEELPSSYVPEAQSSLSKGLAEALRVNSVQFSSVQGMSTPRRLAVLVNDIAVTQQTTSKKVKGPPVSSSFDSDGKPKPAAIGFAAKHGLTVEALEREQQGDQSFLIAHVVSEGKPVTEVLQEIIPKLVSQLSGERMMRWGSSDFKFSRPIRWLVSLLDKEVVEFTVNNLKAGRTSYGHRILHPQAITISSPDAYVGQLFEAAVQVDPVQRRETIEREVGDIAASLNGKPRQLSGSLLDEVVNITEWPCAIAGEFATEYLDLPDTLIETVMVHHQKYFPVERGDSNSGEEVHASHGRLLPHFIAVSNNNRPEAKKQIKQGNERVLKARLADGRFFYFDDQKTSLSDRRAVVSQLTFQDGLGSYGDKVARMLRVGLRLADQLSLGANIKVPLERTLELCKSDLVTSLVRELPELQGFVGAWYAEQEGQPLEVVQAIASHYAPRSGDDVIPKDLVGQLASVIDKADNLVGLFSIGKKPTGSSDPFALRRQAQGLVDVLMVGLTETPVNVTSLLKQLVDEYEPLVAKQKKSVAAEKVIEEVTEFLIQRIKTKLATVHSRREVVEAAIAASVELNYLPNISNQCKALDKLIGEPGGESAQLGIDLVRAGVRIGNILKTSANETTSSSFDASILTEDAETKLWDAYKQAFPVHGADEVEKILWRVSDYESTLSQLSTLIVPINKFFEEVMVNDENLARRKNRHALLQAIYVHFKRIADFSKLQSLIG